MNSGAFLKIPQRYQNLFSLRKNLEKLPSASKNVYVENLVFELFLKYLYFIFSRFDGASPLFPTPRASPIASTSASPFSEIKPKEENLNQEIRPKT